MSSLGGIVRRYPRQSLAQLSSGLCPPVVAQVPADHYAIYFLSELVKTSTYTEIHIFMDAHPVKCVFGVGSAKRPDGPHQSGVAHGFCLIPVSGVGVVADEVKTGGNGMNSGTPRSDMVADGKTFEKHTGSLKYLSQRRCIG